MPKKPQIKPQTLTITNFSGRLSRVINGDINSGYAKYDTSWGYNPFWKPGNLTWFKAPTNVTSIITDSSLVLSAKSRWESGTLYTYAITDTGKIFKIAGEGSSASNLATLSTGTPTFSYGADLEFYNGKIWITNDKGISRIDFDGTSETQVGTWNSSNFIQNTYHSLREFAGKLYVGNTTDGTNPNIGEIGTGNIFLAQQKLSPALPVGTYVRDLDVSTDLAYLLLSVSRTPVEATAPVNDTGNTAATDSEQYRWNGVDTGVTSGTTLPSFGITALNTFGPYEWAFMYDTLGASLYEDGNKKLTMRNCKSPFPNASVSTGNFITWMVPEMTWSQVTAAASIKGSLFYYGSLDDTIGPGLWRPLQFGSGIGGVIYQTPFNHFTTNRYLSVDGNTTVQVDSNGTHLYSYVDYTGSAGTTAKKLNVFYIAPPDDSPAGWSGPTSGVYETQNQLFSKRISVSQVRVYTEPTVSGNGFQLDIIGGANKPITNGTFTYSFGNPVNPADNSSSLERINFNPGTQTLYSLGIRITNTGTTNMCIKKIEIDYLEEGK